MHWPTVGGLTSWSGCTTEIASFCVRNDSDLACPGMSASNSVSAPGTVRPVAAPLVAASEGLVLETSMTSMLVIASSVHGIGIEALTPFARTDEGPADFATRGERYGRRVGKVTHPSAAPENHLLAVWSPGPANHQYNHYPMVDGGLYLIKDGKPIDEPGQMLLIKNDPNYNEMWPRALVPYQRIYGIKEPKKGFVIRGGREIDDHYECLWELFRSIPSIEVEDASVLEEFYRLDKDDPNSSLQRATVNRGQAWVAGREELRDAKTTVELR